MHKLSVIVPFVNEYPQVLFTIQSIAQDLIGKIDFEIIAINNYCDEVGREEDKSMAALEGAQRVNPWLKVLHYKDKLSHWNAKNFGVRASSGNTLWFCDAHCFVSRGSLQKMFQYYVASSDKSLNGTLHLPLTYKILESRRLVYKMVHNSDIGEFHYSFTPYRPAPEWMHYQVPCMSTCGMMMTTKLYDQIGGWPEELGIYGGGENFLNYTLAILGKTVNIFHGSPLHHHGEKRGYSWNYDDYTRNRIIATYIFGGRKLASLYTKHRKGNPKVLKEILDGVLLKCNFHREFIKKQQVISLDDWLKQWEK